MNRRGFLSALLGTGAALTIDPERLLWRPGAKLISIPKPQPVGESMFFLDEINYTTLRYIHHARIEDNFFVNHVWMARIVNGGEYTRGQDMEINGGLYIQQPIYGIGQGVDS